MTVKNPLPNKAYVNTHTHMAYKFLSKQNRRQEKFKSHKTEIMAVKWDLLAIIYHCKYGITTAVVTDTRPGQNCRTGQ